MNPNRVRPVLSALEGLRGVAALLVVLDHTYANFVGVVAATPGQFQPWPLGTLGVATFFVISGFIMVHVHGEDFGKPAASTRFFARRIARIVPFYTLMTLVYTIRLSFTDRMPGWADLARSLLFIPYQSPTEPYGHPVLGQGWTLNYEALFYMVFGLALIMRRGLGLVVAVMLGLFVLGRLGLFPRDSWLGFWSQPDILFFLAGIAIGVMRPRLRTGLDFPAALGLALACSAVGVVAGFAWHARFPLQMLLAPAAIGATAACGWARERDRSSVLRSTAQRIGSATFAIYLSHTFVIGPAAKFAAAHAPGLPAWAFVPIMFALGTAFGIVVHHLVERPLEAVMDLFEGSSVVDAVSQAVSVRRVR